MRNPGRRCKRFVTLHPRREDDGSVDSGGDEWTDGHLQQTETQTGDTVSHGEDTPTRPPWGVQNQRIVGQLGPGFFLLHQTLYQTSQIFGQSCQTLSRSSQTLGNSSQTLGQSSQTLDYSGQILGQSRQTLDYSGQTLNQSCQTLGQSTLVLALDYCYISPSSGLLIHKS
ncbi:hypothetical protein CRUP_030838 [Coryphaenoides rupestris]|nr:hypothetical protein CRUP_030838 [Coryphaenoides rupestris]